MYEVCERLDITYAFGLSINPVLQRASEELLAEAVRLWDGTREPQRLFAAFWHRAGSWPVSRFVVVKGANAQGTNRRFVVTDRAGAPRYLGAPYDEYVMRGESEDRNKELKCGIGMDRLSDHRFMANYFRLYLHSVSTSLVVRPWLTSGADETLDNSSSRMGERGRCAFAGCRPLFDVHFSQALRLEARHGVGYE
jgi:hypothetical protein